MKNSTTAFAFVAERLCLDFANTVDWHATEHAYDRLHTAADFLRWGEAAQVLEPQVNHRLAQYTRTHPDQATLALNRARALREVIYRIFSAVSHEHPPAAADLEALTQARLEAAQQQRLQPEGTAFHWEWTEAITLDRLWWPVAVDAADLLTSDLRTRVGECADDRGCGWLFLDTSKSGRRRWCSMKDCGNRAKAQRHRATSSKPQLAVGQAEGT